MTIPRDDLIWTLNQYRAAEIRGAGVILRLGRLADSHQLRVNLSRHLRDEGVHAWLWTRAIDELGGQVTDVDDAYQVRLGTLFGLPKDVNELLALTLVAERRGVATYTQHLGEPDNPPIVEKSLRAVLRDEKWHVEYIADELARRAQHDPAVGDAIARAEIADAQVIEELQRQLGVMVTARP